MNAKTLSETSKFLSYVLRHEPQTIGLSLDREGWAGVDSLIKCAENNGKTLSRDLIERVVLTSDKKRFSLSDDGLKIRAAQGHSTPSVKLKYEPKQPPAVLFHGTATRFMDSIMANGLVPGSRHHVHLSEQKSTAIDVGKRYGNPVVLLVDAKGMNEQGFAFLQAENGVWLTDHVPATFINANELDNHNTDDLSP